MKKHDCIKWREEGFGCSICNGIVRKFSKEDILKYQKDMNWHISELKTRNKELENIYKLAKTWVYEVEAPATVIEQRLFDAVNELKEKDLIKEESGF
ncbi:MAG: hypothetical protein AABY22_33715 [Nanoarchaeota archaeon]